MKTDEVKFDIIISGLCRNGTSLTMLLLNQCGKEIAGKKFLAKSKTWKEKNPDGFWEDRDYLNGIKEIKKEDAGKCVKVMISKLNKEYMLLKHSRKIVVVFRNPNDFAYSWKNFIDKDSADSNICTYRNQYFSHYFNFLNLFFSNPDLDLTKYLFLNYDSLVGNPRQEIERLCRFAGCVCPEGIESAIREKKEYPKTECPENTVEASDEVYSILRVLENSRLFYEAKNRFYRLMSNRQQIRNGKIAILPPRPEIGRRIREIPPPDAAEKTLPSLPKQAVSFAKAAAKQALSGFPVRTQEDVNRIQQICRQCEYYIENNGRPRCSRCGCFLNVKARWETANCPVGKW